MKRILTLVMSVIMLFSLSSTSFADSQKSDTSNEDVIFLVGEQAIPLKVGESVTIPFVPIQTKGTIQPAEVFPGDGGTLTLTATGTSVNWSIALTVPANAFTGILRITDINAGFNISNGAVSGFSGFVPYTAIKGHMYSASLDGVATLLGVPVAKTTYNYILWNINR